MSPEKTDFYLASTESYAFEATRRCFVIRRLRASRRDDYLLVKIDPPVIGQKYGLGGLDIEEVIIATRHVGDTLFPISKWPLAVHVARLLNKLSENANELADNEFEQLAWAELYPNEEAARRKDC